MKVAMKDFQRIAVLIDEPSWARNLILYSRELMQIDSTKEIHLVHVLPETTEMNVVSLAAAEGITIPYPTQTAEERRAAIEAARAELTALAGEFFRPEDTVRVEISVLAGSPLYESLSYGMQNDIDLIVLGRHYARGDSRDESATMARRITRKATCSVLVVPEVCDTLPTRILVPVRDSECSALALETACTIAASTKGTVFPYNLFPLQDQITLLRGPIEEIVASIEAIAQNECRNLISRVDTRNVQLETICRADRDGNPTAKFIEAADHLAADAIVIGARGRTGAAGILLGKITEKLIEKSTIPVLAVKKKGEQIGVLKAILALARA